MREVHERVNEPMCAYGMKFLETLSSLWPIQLASFQAEQVGDFDTVDRLREDEKPIVENAKKYLSTALMYRLATVDFYDKYAKIREREDERCKNDFAYFINYYCWTSDPRMPALGLPAELPFIMWPEQERFLVFVDDCYRARRSWLAEKSRGWGLTWLMAAYYVWCWKYDQGWIGGFGSRDKEAVDKLGDPDTIFAKVRYIIYRLPQLMRPEAYRGKSINSQSSHDSVMRIYNPEMETTIRGEGGDNIGAGGRASIYTIDESALVSHPEKIDDSLSYTTNCRGDISTVRGMNHFGEKRFSGRVRVFTAWWYADPAKNPEWRTFRRPAESPFHQHEVLRLGGLVVAQELDIDYQRSVEDAFIPAKWLQACVDFDLDAVGERASGFDVAGGGDNQSAYVFRVGPVVSKPHELPYNTPQEALEEALTMAERDRVGLFTYDHDGVGESVWGHIKVTDRKLRCEVFGVHGNAPASERYIFEEARKANERFRNKRTENWWNVRERARRTFEHKAGIRHYDSCDMLSLPNDTKLITQLSQPKKVILSGGKIGVETKKEMHSRGVKSPDLADAVILSFADPDKASMVMSNFSYQQGRGNVEEFEVNHEDPIGQQYVSLVLGEAMVTYALACWWTPTLDAPQLRVYGEFVEPSPGPRLFIEKIRDVVQPEIKPVKAWICNKEMIKGLGDGQIAPWHMYRKAGVTLKQNYTDDYSTSIMLVNQMFSNRMITLHPSCDKLFMQLANWRIEDGKPRPNLGLAMALCQLVSVLKKKREIRSEHLSPTWKPRLPYRGGVGHFAKTAKTEDAGVPAYLKLAQKQIAERSNAERKKEPAVSK